MSLLNTLPTELEAIVTDYKHQFEEAQHVANFDKYAGELKRKLAIRQEDVQYTYGLNNTIWELYCFHEYGQFEYVHVLVEYGFMINGMVTREFEYFWVDTIEHE